MDPKLTLEKVNTLTHQREVVREQQDILGASTKATSSIDQKSSQKGKRSLFQSPKASTARSQPHKSCMRSGRGDLQSGHRGQGDSHPRSRMLAKPWDRAPYSHSKLVAQVSDIPQSDQEYDGIAYLNTLGSQDGNSWTCDM